MEKLYIVSKNMTGSNCGSDHKLLIAKFRLTLKKVGKTTRPLRYDLNQIHYNYKVEVTNRFKGLDLIDRMPEELWTEIHDIIQKAVIKTIPKKKKCKKAKQLAKTRPGSDCGSDHQLFTEKLRLKSKKVGKTTRPFR